MTKVLVNNLNIFRHFLPNQDFSLIWTCSDFLCCVLTSVFVSALLSQSSILSSVEGFMFFISSSFKPSSSSWGLLEDRLGEEPCLKIENVEILSPSLSSSLSLSLSLSLSRFLSFPFSTSQIHLAATSSSTSLCVSSLSLGFIFHASHSIWMEGLSGSISTFSFPHLHPKEEHDGCARVVGVLSRDEGGDNEAKQGGKYCHHC